MKYNLEKLIKVICLDFYESRHFTYLDEDKKILGITYKKRGFYHDFIHKVYWGKEIPINHTMIGGLIYENPTVIMYFQGDIEKRKQFKTHEEAKSFMDKITAPIKFTDFK